MLMRDEKKKNKTQIQILHQYTFFTVDVDTVIDIDSSTCMLQ